MDLYVTLEEVFNGNFIEVCSIRLDLPMVLSNGLGCSSQTNCETNIWFKKMQLSNGNANNANGSRTCKYSPMTHQVCTIQLLRSKQ